ncbi:MAG: glutathione S-transferase family protein [Caldimonas sp.]
MRLYYHPASTTSRTVMLFAAESGIPLDMKVVDLFTGEHTKPEFETINPNHLVPVLEDGDFRLTESSAILKYLADKAGSPLYPKDLQARARVNERMDWINTQLCRDFAYGFVYPQIFSFHKRRSDEAQDATLQWGKERAQGWLKVLNDDILGAGNAFLCGEAMTIADHFAAPFVALGELRQRLLGLSQRAALARPHEVAQALEPRVRGHQRLRRDAEGPADAGRLTGRRQGVRP